MKNAAIVILAAVGLLLFNRRAAAGAPGAGAILGFSNPQNPDFDTLDAQLDDMGDLPDFDAGGAGLFGSTGGLLSGAVDKVAAAGKSLVSSLGFSAGIPAADMFATGVPGVIGNGFGGGAVGGMSAAAPAAGLTAVGAATVAGAFAVPVGLAIKSRMDRSNERKAAAPVIRQAINAMPITIDGVTGLPFDDPRTGRQLLAPLSARKYPKVGKARAIAGVYDPIIRQFGMWSVSEPFQTKAQLWKQQAASERFRESDKR